MDSHLPYHSVDQPPSTVMAINSFLRCRRRQLLGLLVFLVFVLYWQHPALQKSFRTQVDMHTPGNFSPTLSHSNQLSSGSSSPPLSPLHPIKLLIQQAESTFDGLLAKQTHDLAGAAEAYRGARRRHPPPGFDAWHAFAQERDVIIVESFWDQIYEDLNPFWALPPNMIRNDARAFNMAVNVRNGTAQSNTGWFWHTIWAEMIDTISGVLPDMIIPLNPMDEPRLLVPWEDINAYMEIGKPKRDTSPSDEVTSRYKGWGIDGVEEDDTSTQVTWKDTAVYSLARQACPPDSVTRDQHTVPDSSQFMRKAIEEHKLKRPQEDFTSPHSYRGFVSNYSLSTSICHQPDLGGLHGALIHPLTSSFSQQLIPLFGGSKLTVNNEILLPAPMYWHDDGRFGAGQEDQNAWNNKEPTAVWRGTATGGRNTPTNWNHFHRHRFVALTNGTKYRGADRHSDDIFSMWLRVNSINTLQNPVRQHFGDWLDLATNIAFTDLMCDAPSVNGSCWYTDDDFQVKEPAPLQQQFSNKYLPDIDGNSFSGRYRAFLLSNSLPIKATLYREWHDSRLVAWRHFVPMDNRFGDFYTILEYFRGFEGFGGRSAEKVPGHDEDAEMIALEGRDWAKKVLRKEDMQVYVLRLLLEYARITDDHRETLGWMGDLRADVEDSHVQAQSEDFEVEADGDGLRQTEKGSSS